MSSDKRLGTNPLSWVDPNATVKPNDIPVSDATISSGTPSLAPHAMRGGLFVSADSINPEDLMEKGKVKIKETLEAAQVAEHLKDLAQSLESGIIRAKNGEHSIVLGVSESISFEMKLSGKKDKAKCSIEMEWKDNGEKTKEQFKISDK